MATIKSHTDIPQSKKLSEILPLDSADMYYFLDPTPAGNIYHLVVQQIGFGVKTREPEYDRGDIPCWSLAALLDVLPDESDIVKGKVDVIDDKYMCTVCIKEELVTAFSNNPVNACYEMILKLKEKELI